MSLEQAATDPIDGKQFRQALGRYATGVTVVTTRGKDGKLEGLTANSFASVSLDPPLVLWSLRKQAASLPAFRDSGWFAVNVLGSQHEGVSRHFATPAAEKFSATTYRPGLNGCPVLPDAIASFECSVEQQVDAGDHVVFIGRVRRLCNQDGDPLVFSGGTFCRAEPSAHKPNPATTPPNH